MSPGTFSHWGTDIVLLSQYFSPLPILPFLSSYRHGSLVPRPYPTPVFDRLQYAEWRGEAWEQGCRCSASFTFLALLRSPFSPHLFFISLLLSSIFHLSSFCSPLYHFLASQNSHLLAWNPGFLYFVALFPDSPCAVHEEKKKAMQAGQGLGTRLALVVRQNLEPKA